MKVSCNIATFPAREQSLKTMLPSVLSQFDEVRVYFNKYPKVPKWAKDMGVKGTVGQDLTDNGGAFSGRYDEGDIVWSREAAPTPAPDPD